jgi:hypothetical protein
MGTRTQKRIARSDGAGARRLRLEAEIGAMLARLQALSDEHFGYAPEDVTWADVGTLEHYAGLLTPHHRLSLQGGRAHGVAPPISARAPRGKRRRGSGS